MEGFGVLPALDAAERGDVFITVTGSRDVLRREHFLRMRDGAILAKPAQDDEVAMKLLRTLSIVSRRRWPVDADPAPLIGVPPPKKKAAAAS